MQCPKCAHKIPDKSHRCLYCGAWTKDETSSEKRTESRALWVPSGKLIENLIDIQGTKEEINYKKLEELPLSLRAKVEEVLKKGEGQGEDTMEGRKRKRKKMGFLEALRFLLKKD